MSWAGIDSNYYRFHIEGDDYFHGRNGNMKDEEKAVELWLKGAELGNVQCMRNLAWAHYNGIGTEKDDEKAFEYWLKGAALGEEQCAKNVVWAYNAGIGCKPDRDAVAKWTEFLESGKCKETGRKLMGYEGDDLNPIC